MKKLALPTPLRRRGLGVVVLLLTAVSLFTFRTASAQEADHPKKRMSIAMTNASLDDVLQQIKQQTGYLLLYNSNEIKAVRGITINRQQAPVEEILREVLKGSGFDFSISEDTIVIRLGERPLNSPPNGLRSPDASPTARPRPRSRAPWCWSRGRPSVRRPMPTAATRCASRNGSMSSSR